MLALMSRCRLLGLIGRSPTNLNLEDHILAGTDQDQPLPRSALAFVVLQNLRTMPARDDLHFSDLHRSLVLVGYVEARR
jgi:hypothetical protein